MMVLEQMCSEEHWQAAQTALQEMHFSALAV